MTAAAVGVVLVLTAGSIAFARETARSTSPRLEVQPTTSTRATSPNTTSLSIGPTTTSRPPHQLPYDLVGDAPSIPLNRTGVYTWTSSVVLPFAPNQFNFTSQLGGAGTAQVTNLKDTLVPVKGGYSLRVTFTVNSVTGSPTLQPIAYASGPIPSVAPRGSVFIPNVVGMTRAQATNVLNRVHLGVIVAVASTAKLQIVVAQSPIPGTALRINGAVTITLGSRATTGP